MLPPVRTSTNTLRDDARALTRSQLEKAIGSVTYLERELLARKDVNELTAEANRWRAKRRRVAERRAVARAAARVAPRVTERRVAARAIARAG